MRSQPAAAALVLEEFPAEQAAKFLAASSPDTAKHIIEHFTPAFAVSCLLSIEPPAAGQIFPQLHPDLQIMLLRQLDLDKRESLLNMLQPDLAATIRHLLPYHDGTAGALMEAPLASVPEDLSVRDTLKRIKRIRRGMKFYIYVTNTIGQLTGVLTLHELINARPGSIISQVMHQHVVSLSPAQSVLTVLNSPYWLEYHALPVTDENNVLLGVIREKGMRRFQEQSLHADAVSSGLGTFMAVGELFSVTAGHLLAALIATGTSLPKRDSRG
jgi:magnesium transporter